MALRTNGVLVGSSILAGLAIEGTEGVRKIIAGTNRELCRVLSLVDSAKLDKISFNFNWY